MSTEVEKEMPVSNEIANDLRLMSIALKKKVSLPPILTCEEIVRLALADKETAHETGASA